MGSNGREMDGLRDKSVKCYIGTVLYGFVDLEGLCSVTLYRELCQVYLSPIVGKRSWS